MADRYQVRQTKSPLSTRSLYHTANPNSGKQEKSGEDDGFDRRFLYREDCSPPEKKTTKVDYPSWVHSSLKTKYSAETIHYTINFYDGQDPLQIRRLTNVSVPDLIECLTYMKLIHGSDLSVG